MTKYGAVRVERHGIHFDSQAEARRYAELELLQRAGEISDLVPHPRYELVVNGMKVATYVADASYRDAEGRLTVEDTKGVRTDVYRLKAKLMLACHGIVIAEVDA